MQCNSGNIRTPESDPKEIVFVSKVAGYLKLARDSLTECFDGTTVETAR